jgi:hypothetical protein
MRKHTKALLIISALITSLAVAPALLADDSSNHGMTNRDGMMGHGGVMGMMRSMMKMMEHCSSMMSEARPNDQWKNTPSAPGDQG